MNPNAVFGLGGGAGPAATAPSAPAPGGSPMDISPPVQPVMPMPQAPQAGAPPPPLVVGHIGQVNGHANYPNGGGGNYAPLPVPQALQPPMASHAPPATFAGAGGVAPTPGSQQDTLSKVQAYEARKTAHKELRAAADGLSMPNALPACVAHLDAAAQALATAAQARGESVNPLPPVGNLPAGAVAGRRGAAIALVGVAESCLDFADSVGALANVTAARAQAAAEMQGL